MMANYQTLHMNDKHPFQRINIACQNVTERKIGADVSAGVGVRAALSGLVQKCAEYRSTT